jgi:ubiquinone/menaquinone biosynthesis C-methylase UbiE
VKSPGSDKVRRRYDRWSTFYDAYDLGGVTDHKKRAVDALELAPDALVLDVGTGTGAILPYLSGKLGEGGLAVGFDFSRAMAARARKRILKRRLDAKVDAVAADSTALPFRDGSFDAALATFAFTSFPEPERAMRDVARVLRPGGRFAVLDTGKPDGKEPLGYRWLKTVMWTAGYTDITMDVPGMLERSGFEIECLDGFKGSYAYICLAIRK